MFAVLWKPKRVSLSVARCLGGFSGRIWETSGRLTQRFDAKNKMERGEFRVRHRSTARLATVQTVQTLDHEKRAQKRSDGGGGAGFFGE